MDARNWLHACVIQHDAVSNLRKAKSLYVSRQQELDKLKEQASKAENESLSLAVVGNAAVVKADAKTERKKKQEDDALQKVCINTVPQLLLLLLLCDF